MKPVSILLLTAAGLASALPAQPFVPRSAVQNAPVARSFLDRAIEAIGARDLVPLNANTAALPVADSAADKKSAAAPPPAAAAPPAVATTSAAAVAAQTTAAAANNAASAATSAAAAATDAAAATTDAVATAAATTAAATTTAAGAIATNAAAAGNGTASAGNDGKGKGKGKGKGAAGNAAGKGKGQGQKHGNGNNNDNAISVIITSALGQLGLDGVLDASKVNALSGGQQVQLLAQIISLQTMSDLKMINSNDVVVVLNQGFKNSGLNVVINA